MKVSEVHRAVALLSLASFVKAASASSRYTDGVLILKSRTQGSPEIALAPEDKRVVIDTLMAYCEDELERLGVEPDEKPEEAPEEAA